MTSHSARVAPVSPLTPGGRSYASSEAKTPQSPSGRHGLLTPEQIRSRSSRGWQRHNNQSGRQMTSRGGYNGGLRSGRHVTVAPAGSNVAASQKSARFTSERMSPAPTTARNTISGRVLNISPAAESSCRSFRNGPASVNSQRSVGTTIYNGPPSISSQRSAQRSARSTDTGLDPNISKTSALSKEFAVSNKGGKSYETKLNSVELFFRGIALFFGHSQTVRLRHPNAVEAVRALKISSWQLRRLRLKFQSVDLDNSGTIDAPEFFEMLGTVQSALTDELFKLVDLDSSGTIDFDEFVAVLLTYCVYSKEDILRFCFNCFDRDHSNSIDESEFIALLAALNSGAPLFAGNYRTALQQFDSNADGVIDFNEFMTINDRYPLVFFPAFKLQDQMQRKTLGRRAWLRIHDRINRQRALDEHRKTHGTEPTLSLSDFCCFLCTDHTEIDLSTIDKRKPSKFSSKERQERQQRIIQGASSLDTTLSTSSNNSNAGAAGLSRRFSNSSSSSHHSRRSRRGGPGLA